MYSQTSCGFSMNPNKITLTTTGPRCDDGSSSSSSSGGESGRHPFVENRSSITVSESRRPIAENRSSLFTVGEQRPIAENRSSFTFGEQRPIAENRSSFSVVERPVVRECSDPYSIAVRSELQRTFSEIEIHRKYTVENVKFRVAELTLRLLGVSSEDFREYLHPDKVFIHPQVAMKIDSIFVRQKCLRRNDYTGRTLDRILAYDYNDLKDVQVLVAHLEELADKCNDCKIVAELRTVLASDGLGDCSRHLRYPLSTHTKVRARPIGSDYDAGRVHVMAVRKMYESNPTTNKTDVGKAITTFYQLREAGERDGFRPELEKRQSELVGIYERSVGSFADQVWKEVVEPKLRLGNMYFSIDAKQQQQQQQKQQQQQREKPMEEERLV